MLFVSSTFIRPTHARAIGAVAGLIVGAIGPVGMLLEPWPTNLDWAIAGALVTAAPILGWTFGPEAAGPRLVNGLRAALWAALSGVVLGAFLTAAIWTAFSEGAIPLGLIGLLIFGVPALLPGIALALVWVGAVRLCVRTLRVK
jgi:hypothetical protein